jgi:hypothetical protein
MDQQRPALLQHGRVEGQSLGAYAGDPQGPAWAGGPILQRQRKNAMVRGHPTVRCGHCGDIHIAAIGVNDRRAGDPRGVNIPARELGARDGHAEMAHSELRAVGRVERQHRILLGHHQEGGFAPLGPKSRTAVEHRSALAAERGRSDRDTWSRRRPASDAGQRTSHPASRGDDAGGPPRRGALTGSRVSAPAAPGDSAVSWSVLPSVECRVRLNKRSSRLEDAQHERIWAIAAAPSVLRCARGESRLVFPRGHPLRHFTHDVADEHIGFLDLWHRL